MLSKNVTCSIVIVSYNTKTLLHNCLKSIYQTVPQALGFEVVVVDNNSSDGSAELVRREFPKVRLLANTCNKGFAAANNEAIPFTSGKYILLLNPDTVVLPQAVEKAIAFLDGNQNAGIVACKLLNEDRSLQPSLRGFPSLSNVFFESTFLYKMFPHNSITGAYYYSWFRYDRSIEVDVPSGAFLMIRRGVIDAIGLFDEQFYMYSEETDFCFRVRKAGFQTWFLPEAEIVHVRSQSAKQNWGRMFKQLHESRVKFYRKHFRGLYLLSLLFLEYFSVFVRIPVHFFIGLVTFNNNEVNKALNFVKVFVKLDRVDK